MLLIRVYRSYKSRYYDTEKKSEYSWVREPERARNFSHDTSRMAQVISQVVALYIS